MSPIGRTSLTVFAPDIPNAYDKLSTRGYSGGFSPSGSLSFVEGPRVGPLSGVAFPVSPSSRPSTSAINTWLAASVRMRSLTSTRRPRRSAAFVVDVYAAQTFDSTDLGSVALAKPAECRQAGLKHEDRYISSSPSLGSCPFAMSIGRAKWRAALGDFP